MSIYKEILKQNLPRLLSCFDLDKTSVSYGFADRLYWGWKVSDFSNATFQGGINALAVAFKLGLIENRNFVLEIVDASLNAVDRIKAKNGSLGEAYPNENSFCVTALVAYDCLFALHLLKDEITDEKIGPYCDILKPLIEFITEQDEEHALISNHLATGVAAIILWNTITGNENKRHRELLQLIYDHQSQEGWYKEYEGADPGYQTLCTYYLAAAYEFSSDKKLLESLLRSANFLKYFVHPDGTIGGLYGSRNTEVYYPGGILYLSSVSEDFAVMFRGLERGIQKQNHILPQNVDSNNFIPLLNSYAFAALYPEENLTKDSKNSLPCFEIFSHKFHEAGIVIHSTAKYYSITNYKKGGALKVFDKVAESMDMEDGGIFGLLTDGTKFSTQQFDNQIEFQDNTIIAAFYKTNTSFPNPLNFIVLRLLSLSVFRSVALGNVFKKMIVKMLMTGKHKLSGSVVRHFKFEEDRIIIIEKISAPEKTENIGHYGFAKAIHMASSGYYNNQKPCLTQPSKLVEFVQK